MANIQVVTTEYDATQCGPFPEAARYDEWLAAELAALYPGHTVEVSYGPTSRVTADDIEVQVEVWHMLTDLWETFCSHGYKEYS